MDNLMSSWWFFLLFLLSMFLLRLFKQTRLRNNLPPGPSRLPILGNLLLLGKKPHKSLAEIAKVHGPIVFLQFGWLNTVVVSSPSVAHEMFQKNDAVFADRTVRHSITAHGHDLASIVFLPAGPHWRYLRRICTTHIFAPNRLDATRQLRIKKLGELVTYVRNCCEPKTVVNIGQAMFTTSLNILSNTTFSVDFANLSSFDSTGHELKDLVWGLLEVGAEANISDFFPILKHVDPQGSHRRAKRLIGKMIKIFDEMIEQRLRLRRSSDSGHDEDLLDILLRINKVEKANNEPIDIPHLMLDLFVAGTDPISGTLEWAMAELLHNPEKMRKSQEELDKVVGHSKNLVTEDHIAHLPYLQAIIKETMRLHPIVPFLIPRKVNTTEYVELCKYKIPKGTQVLVNVWAIGRDKSVWQDAELFLPERFLGSSVDFRGHHYELLPFGTGRRMCPGIPMALKILPLALGSMIHKFDWRVKGGGEIDMDDKFGISLLKAKPLCAIPYCR